VLAALAHINWFAVAVSVNNALTPHTPRPYALGAIIAGYHLTGITSVAAIIGALPA
jgi:hypothetical protein